MRCLDCKELTRVLESARIAHKRALASSFYLVSTEIAARMEVDMERSQIALMEHQEACLSFNITKLEPSGTIALAL